jgi:hypothetical protein
MGETVDNGRRRIMQGADILDPQNELGEGEFLREWIFFRDVVKMVEKSVNFNAFLLQGGKEETAVCLLIKSDPMVPNCKYYFSKFEPKEPMLVACLISGGVGILSCS